MADLLSRGGTNWPVLGSLSPTRRWTSWRIVDESVSRWLDGTAVLAASAAATSTAGEYWIWPIFRALARLIQPRPVPALSGGRAGLGLAARSRAGGLIARHVLCRGMTRNHALIVCQGRVGTLIPQRGHIMPHNWFGFAGRPPVSRHFPSMIDGRRPRRCWRKPGRPGCDGWARRAR